MNKSRFQDAGALLRAAMCQFRASCTKNTVIHPVEVRREALIFCWVLGRMTV
jgi:hypothetical protein